MASTTARKSLWDPSTPMTTTTTMTADPPQRTTRDILRTANDINGVADATLAELDMHGKKITKAQDDVASINDRMNGADRLIYEIGSFWGSLMNKFRSGPNQTEHAGRRDQWEAEHSDRMAAYRDRDEYKRGMSSAPTMTPNAPPMYQDDEDGDLDQIHEAVIAMRHKAVLMGEAIEDHNHRLDSLRDETDIATSRIRTARGNIGTILKK